MDPFGLLAGLVIGAVNGECVCVCVCSGKKAYQMHADQWRREGEGFTNSYT